MCKNFCLWILTHIVSTFWWGSLPNENRNCPPTTLLRRKFASRLLRWQTPHFLCDAKKRTKNETHHKFTARKTTVCVWPVPLMKNIEHWSSNSLFICSLFESLHFLAPPFNFFSSATLVNLLRLFFIVFLLVFHARMLLQVYTCRACLDWTPTVTFLCV